MEVIQPVSYSNNVLNYDDNEYAYAYGYAWTSFFSIDFDNVATATAKQIVINFYDNVVRELDNGWSVYNKYDCVDFIHYANKQEHKYIIRINYKSNKKLLDFYLIGHANKYVTCTLEIENKENNEQFERIKITTHATIYKEPEKLIEDKSTNSTIKINNTWILDDRIIIEYLNNVCPQTKTHMYFYLIHHTKKPIVEIWNGCHWIFKCKTTIEPSIDLCKTWIKSDATSCINHPFEGDSFTPSFSDANAISVYPGDLIFFSDGKGNLQVDGEQLFNRNAYPFIDESVYNMDTCKYIKEIGYDLSQYNIQNYDYTFISDHVNKHPCIVYKYMNPIYSFETKKYVSNRKERINSTYESYDYGTSSRRARSSGTPSRRARSSGNYCLNFHKSSNLNENFQNHCNKYTYCTASLHGICFVVATITWFEQEEHAQKRIKFNARYVNPKVYQEFIESVNDVEKKELVRNIIENKTLDINDGNYNDLLNGDKENHKENLKEKLKTDKVVFTYNEKYKEFNLSICRSEHNKNEFIDGEGEPEDGGIVSCVNGSRKVAPNQNKTSETNTKFDMNEKKIVRNEGDSGSLVEVEMLTQQAKVIRTGYKYGWVKDDDVGELEDPNKDNATEVVIVLELLEKSVVISSPQKHRTNLCKIIRIYDPITQINYDVAYGKYMTKYKYHINETITIHNFPMSNEVCCRGIHFCDTLDELGRYW
jgi:hypothetical protein